MSDARRDIEIGCRCGQVRGVVRGVTRHTTNRVVCYCDDCQAFAHHLGRADLLDAHGGSDIGQCAPAALRFTQGTDRIAAIRLTAKGAHRWFATCCATPLGNTQGIRIPFVGLHVASWTGLPDAAARTAALGPARAAVMEKFAVGAPPRSRRRDVARMVLHVVRLLATWKLRGAWPNPFFERDGAPRFPVTVLPTAERDALRARCGPTPTAGPAA